MSKVTAPKKKSASKAAAKKKTSKAATSKRSPAKKQVKKSSTRKTTSRRKASQKQGIGGFFQGLATKIIETVMTYTVVAIAGAAVIAVLMLFAGGYFFNVGTHLSNGTAKMAKASGFSVSRVTVKGAHHTNDADILDALYDNETGAIVGKSMLHVDLEAARLAIENIGWVQNAAVVRLWPNTLHVSVFERRPAALWQGEDGRELLLVDRKGSIITDAEGGDYSGLPIIMGARNGRLAGPILDELSHYPDLMDRIVALDYQGSRRWDLRFDNGFQFLLPEDDPVSALEKLVKMEEIGDPVDKLSKIDMRDGKNVFFKVRERSTSSDVAENIARE